jgi:adenine-specific DNA-methyltransferase
MLYYVKTDRLFRSMEVEVPLQVRADPATATTQRFFFDVTALEHKQANEKRDLVYRFDHVREDGTLVFTVEYSSYGSKTKILDILKALRDKDMDLEEDVIQRAFRVFEKQSEVDFFINKDAKRFLKEQFDLWMYRYLFEGENIWLQHRLEMLQRLKELAYKIIDFIAQFEDELVRVWNKPKFVRGSHYVITLDHIAARDAELLGRVLAHAGMAAQVAEWRELGMVGADFTPEDVWARDLFGEKLDARYQYLPLDTRHLPDLELEIVGRFEHLDEALDGWLIHSENYQALNTLRPRFRRRVNFIYIDPPYNSDATEILYANDYKDSSWLSLMNDRLEIAKEYLLPKQGILCVAIDDNELHNLKLLLEDLFSKYDILTVVVEHNYRGRAKNNFALTHEYALWAVEQGLDLITKLPEISDDIRRNLRRTGVGSYRPDAPTQFYGIEVDKETLEIVNVTQSLELDKSIPQHSNPNTEMIWPIDSDNIERRWYYGRETVEKEAKEGTVWAKRINGEIQIHYYQPGKPKRRKSVWTGSELDASTFGSELLNSMFLVREFPFPKSIHAVERSIESATDDKNALILDFFAGSGTTAHAVMNINRSKGKSRKYILVEMGDHFETVILPRIKKAAFCESWSGGKAKGGEGMSHFVKYYALEQYEDTLRNAAYIDDATTDAAPFVDPYTDVYQQYVFLADLKQLHAIEIDPETRAARVDLAQLYPDIDLAETLANLRGKRIARLTAEAVEFEDGERIDLRDPDWELIKPLIWW